MLPPTEVNSQVCVRDWFNGLREDVQAPPKTTHYTQSDRIQGYQSAITAWLTTLTPAQRSRRYAIGELIVLAQMTSVSGNPPADREVSLALERCGFVRLRDWTVLGRNRRHWLYKNGTRT